jgi:hypothetical protein
MPVPSKVFLTTPTDTSTEASGVTGETREHIDATHGKQTYRLVKNTTAGIIVAAVGVIFKSGSSVECLLPAANAPANTFAGVTVGAIPIGHYAWVVCSGNVTATAGAAVLINKEMMTHGTDGQFDDTAIGGLEHAILGTSVSAASGANVAFTMRVSGLI